MTDMNIDDQIISNFKASLVYYRKRAIGHNLHFPTSTIIRNTSIDTRRDDTQVTTRLLGIRIMYTGIYMLNMIIIQ